MSEGGICAIKPEFIVKEPTREINLECVSKEDKKKITSDSDNNDKEILENNEPPQKQPRLSKSEKKKLRGQNKSRPMPYKLNRELQLCHTLIDICEYEEGKKCNNDKCKFMHDVKEYLNNKPKDIGNNCYNFDKFGRCHRGITCRFGSSHITENGYNKVNAEKYDACKDNPTTVNNLSYETVVSLRKRLYDFSRTDKIINENDEAKKKAQEAKASGCVTDEDIVKLRTGEKKSIDWKNKLYLSPLTTVGNLPFRRICKEYGADVTCGEMAMGISLLRGMNPEWALVKRHVTEDIFGVQICGNNPYLLTKAAQLLEETAQVDFVDINLGCPIDLVYKQGGGCGLLRRQNVLGSIVRCVSDVLSIPLTLKTRTGVYSSENVAHTFLPKFEKWGASMVTLHGRSREQRYTKSADWEYINSCAGSVKSMPVFGNGDILSYEDYSFIKENYKNVSGVMIGRGALVKPWIFTEIKEQRLWDISSNERFDILKKYANYGLEHWGSDTKGVENTRRFMLEWLSFMYRYIPVGLLERPPQKINERPPTYFGRNDLETLMASGNCSDWIKISEMLLGPVPENYHFLPKHKANSYK